MKLPKYAQNSKIENLVNILCRGKCQTSRYATIKSNERNNMGTKITSDSKAECLVCGYIASDCSNWNKV